MRAFLLVLLLVLAGFVALWQLDVIELPVGEGARQRAEVRAVQELFALAETGNLNALDERLADGAEVDRKNETGQSLLMISAAQHQDPEMMLRLLEAGADVNAQSQAGMTPLMYALRDNDNPDVPLLLLNAAADPTLRDAEGRSALDHAQDNGAMRRSSVYPLLERLVDSDFDPDWPSGYLVPIEGATFSSRAAHLPGAPRAYRNGYHEGFDFYNGTVSVPITYDAPTVAVAHGEVVRADHNYVELTEAEYQSLLADAAAGGSTPPETLDKLRGKQVWLEHAGGFISRYAHLSGIPSALEVGDRVEPGQVVGFVGNSGTSDAVAGTEDWPHLHFEVWRGDTFLGEGLGPDEVYDLVAQIFGPRTLPPVRGP